MQLLARVVFHQRSQAVVEGRVGAVLKNEIEEIVIDFLALGLAALSTTRTASSSRNEAARAVMRQFNSFQYEAAAGLSIPRTILFAGLRPARNFWSAAFSLLKETRYERASIVRILRRRFGAGYFQGAGSR